MVGTVTGHATHAIGSAQAETPAQSNRADYAEGVANDEHARRVQAEAAVQAAALEAKRHADAVSELSNRPKKFNENWNRQDLGQVV